MVFFISRCYQILLVVSNYTTNNYTTGIQKITKRHCKKIKLDQFLILNFQRLF